MKKYFSIVFALCLCAVSFAQSIVNGTVKDKNGAPVPGAVVMLEDNSSVGSVTAENGTYSLTIPSDVPSSRFVVSCIGFKDQTVSRGKSAVVDIVLEEDSELLEEVVVVGYGSMRRSDLTGSVASVKIDDEQAGISTSLDNLIQGKAAGVEIVNSSASPDASVSIKIRGVTSLNGSSEPLYVVDGVILTEAESVGGLDNYGDVDESVNGLMGINPQDIASIEILKDASATAIYGSAGANGVVLITTKQATKDRPTINVNVGYDFSTPYKHIDVMSTSEWLDRYKNYPYSALESRIQGYITRLENGELTPIVWQEHMMQTAPRNRYYVSVSGRPKTISYNLSIGYNAAEGLVRGTDNSQYTVHLNLDKTFSPKFKMGLKANLGYVTSHTQKGATTTQSYSSLMMQMLSYRPFFVADEGLADEYDDYDDYDYDDTDSEAKASPDKWLKDAYKERLEFRVIPNLYAQYKILPWLTFKTSAGIDYRNSDNTQWLGESVNRTSGGALASIKRSEKYRWTWDNLLLVNYKARKHSISGTAGMTMGRLASTTHIGRYNQIYQYPLELGNVNSSQTTTFDYDEVYASNLSFFVRGIYNYADRYVVTATYRADGSSAFLGGNKFGHFPSFAFAWRLSEEPWFKLRDISMAKIRVGWGRVGNSTVSSYQTYNMFSGTTYANHFSSADYSKALAMANFSNSELKWETTEQVNAGIDFGMWKGRLTLSADAYYKRTYDLLQERSVPMASGFTTRWMNVGEISNRGFELSLEAVPVKTRLFEWSVSGNFSMNRNRLESFGFDMDETRIYFRNEDGTTYYKDCIAQPGENVSGQYCARPGNIYIQGEQLGLYYGILTDGIVQSDDDPGPGLTKGAKLGAGNIRYVDLDGNGYIDDNDCTVIGNPNAGFNYGFRTAFTIGNFNLAVNFQGVGDKQILNANLGILTDANPTNGGNFLREAYYDSWTLKGADAKYPALNTKTNEERYLITDRYIEDGSYLRLSSVTASYRLDMPKKFFVRSITAGVSAQNLYVWTAYSGWDPNVSSFGSSMKRYGIDLGSYPSARTFCFDLKFAF